MFGHRPDGIRLKKVDPIILLTPYLMPTRCDAQVFVNKEIDMEPLTRYIAEKSNEGVRVTFMELIIAAYIRGISQHPACNRFITNRRMYARKDLIVAFAELLQTDDGSFNETIVKIKFDPSDTIFDVARRVEQNIEENRNTQEANGTLALARILSNASILCRGMVGLANFLDHHELIPRFLCELSPFHASMYITNMASIGMTSVNHHIYNFGTVSQFFSLGLPNKAFATQKDGSAKLKRSLPIGAVADERICAGAEYAQLFAEMLRCLRDPHLLETPPERVVYDEGVVISVPKLQ